MTPPISTATVITNPQLASLSDKASGSPRRRANLNVHPELADPVQRMFNAMEPETYVRPHRHARDNGWELMMVIAGRFSILLFDATGRVTDRFDLAAEAVRAVEIPPHTWHAVVSLIPGTLMFEVKQGPYAPLSDKDFAPWAPVEEHPESRRMRDWYARALVGEMPPEWRRDA
jgi:cupin fold WbuC family metalloprotein